ncbi:ATP-binding protein [Paenibacillus sp. sgz500958]|uniref:sensor histidine kinase n=1 Tax=Paenibacillus sp. sgz500958 TaxID=3242475 RepID=UPI0036D2289B
MIRNLRISTKLQLSNLVLILTLVVVTAVSFRILSQRYLIQEARQQLTQEVNQLFSSLSAGDLLSVNSLAERVERRKEFRLAGRLLDTKIIVLNKAGRVLYKNTTLNDSDMLDMRAGRIPDGYLIERKVIQGANGAVKGEVVMGIQIADITGINGLFLRAQLVSMVLGGLLALLIGYVLGKSLSKPLAHLTAGMKNFSVKREQNDLASEVNSGDEIGELSASFMDMAEKLRSNDKLQTDFLQNASHELKTPLMAIQGNAEAIKDGIVKDGEMNASLDVIIHECQQLKTLVDEMIYLTRLDRVKDVYHFEQVEIGDVISEVTSGLEGLALQEGISLSVKGDLAAVCTADRDKLKRVFVNIVGNAIRYARSKVQLKVIPQGDRVVITCTDDGKGFKPGEEKLVFERFYKGEQGGTGIGLAITKAIVQGHGGTIEASSPLTSGAKFEIILRV